jgi:hypothetical protein
MMNKEVILGIVRHVLTIVAGILVSRGQLDPSDAQTVIGGITGIAGVAWSVKHKIG